MTLTPWSAGCEQAGDSSRVSRKWDGMEQGQGIQEMGLGSPWSSEWDIRLRGI